MTWNDEFLSEVEWAIAQLPLNKIEEIVESLQLVRLGGGRLFVLGNGGGAAHAMHAAADFRTLCNLEAYSPESNVANLTALTNDSGWPMAYRSYLEASRFSSNDVLLVISVGGGDLPRNVSPNLVEAIRWAKDAHNAIVLGIVGRDGGYTAQRADVCVLIPCRRPEWTTPIVEGVQSVVLHLIVTAPLLAANKTKWEEVDAAGSISRP